MFEPRKVGWIDKDRKGLHKGGENCLKYLGTEKGRGETTILKRRMGGGGQAGSMGGCLKKRGDWNPLTSYVYNLYIQLQNISLNVVRTTFFSICDLSHFPKIMKIRVKVWPKTNHFSNFMTSCTDRIVVYNNFFSLIRTHPRDKQNRTAIFFFSNIFWIIYF